MSAIFEIVENAYDAARDPGRWPVFLRRLDAELPTRSLLLVLRSPCAGDPGVVIGHGATQALLREYAERLWARDPWRDHLEELDEGALCFGHEHVADEELEHSDFYREWCAPQNLHYPFTVLIKREGPGRCIWLRGFRPKESGPFRRDELGLFQDLTPHVRRAVEIGRAIRTNEVVRDSLLGAIDGGATGWMLLSGDGQLVAADDAAQAALERGDGLLRDGDRVRARDLGADAKLQELLAKAASGGRSGSLTLSPDGLRIQLLPAQRDGIAADALLLLVESRRLAEQRIRQLRESWGLTPAEARVATLLADGRRLQQIAGDLGITINTVRGHLKQVFAKTGTHRQAELVRLLLGTPPVAR